MSHGIAEAVLQNLWKMLCSLAVTRLDEIWRYLFPAEQASIVKLLVEKVIVSPNDLEVRLRANGIERLDGSGYPKGCKGEEILLEARIISVADVVEAMASHRPYRPGLGVDIALAEIERGKGTVYDLVVANACLRMFKEKGYTLPA